MAVWRCMGCCSSLVLLLDWQRVLPKLCPCRTSMICWPLLSNDTKPRRALAPAVWFAGKGVIII